MTSGEFQSADDVAVDAAGNAYVVGTYRETLDFYGNGPLHTSGRDVAVIKFDPEGRTLWVDHFSDSDSSDQEGLAIDVTPAGAVAITGRQWGTVDFGGGPLSGSGDWNVFAVKLDASGHHVWSGVYGGPGSQKGQGIAIDSAGNVTAIGNFEQSIDFGLGTLTNAAGSVDSYVVHLVQ